VFAVNRNPSSTDLHRFGLAMLFGFGVIGALAWCSIWLRTGDRAMLAWSGRLNQIGAIVLWALGVGLCLVGFSSRSIARSVYVVWMTIGVKIGIVASTVLLTVLFIVLLPVFSLVVRLGDPLRKRLTKSGTYWEDYKPHEPTLERMQRLF